MNKELKVTNTSVDTACAKKNYMEVLSEYIWNGFDARATQIRINYTVNELGNLSSITISDDGDGIVFEDIDKTFGAFLTSQKILTKNITDNIHGSKGKGRFSFTNFANLCKWETIYTKDSINYQYNIKIGSDDKSNYEVSEKKEVQSKKGTNVIIEAITEITESDLLSNCFKKFLMNQYAWYLYLNKSKNYNIFINGEKLNYEDFIDTESSEHRNIEIKGIHFSAYFVKWKDDVDSKYYFYMLDSEKRLKHQQHTGYNNNGIAFIHSMYTESPYFNNFIISNKDDDQISLDDDKNNTKDDTYKELMKQLSNFVQEKYKQFIKKQGDIVIQQFEDEQLIPDMSNVPYGEIRKKDLKEIIKGVYVAQPKIFKNANIEQKKSIIGFLNLLIDTNERQNIITIIDSIANLTPEERRDLSSILSRTTLNNIIRTIKMLDQRNLIIEKLKILLFDNTKWTNERNHVQKIIEKNYWIFGEQYNLVTADKPFEKALSEYIYELYGVKENITIEDLEKHKRMDVFLSASRPLELYSNSVIKEENIILELKAPYVDIDREIFRQIENYMLLIMKQPEFNSSTRQWKFYAVSNKFDDFIKSKHKEFESRGLPFLASKMDNFEIYVMTWDDIFKSFEYKNQYLYEKLNFDKVTLEKEIEEEQNATKRDLSNIITTQILDLSKELV